MPLISPCHVTQRDIDESIENDIFYQEHERDEKQLEWWEESEPDFSPESGDGYSVR